MGIPLQAGMAEIADNDWQGRVSLDHLEQAHVFGQIHHNSLSVALHGNALCISDVAEEVHVKLLEFLLVGSNEHVSVFEANLLSLGIEKRASRKATELWLSTVKQ